MFTGPQGIMNKLLRSVKAAALAASLVLSALFTAVALRSPDYHWLPWISFLPLFVAPRWLGCPVPSRGGRRSRGVPHSSRSEGRQAPRHRECGTDGPAKRLRLVSPSPTLKEGGAPAAPAGGLWGACLYVFCIAGPTPAVEALSPAIDATAHAIGLSACVHAQAGPSECLLALLIAIPAVYIALAARLALVPEGHSKIAQRFIAANVVLADDPSPVGTDECRPPVQSSLRDRDPLRPQHPGDRPRRAGLLTCPLRGTFPNVADANPNQHCPDTFSACSGWQQALLTGSQAEGPHLPWLAPLFGYVSPAFLVPWANGSAVGILSGTRLSFPAHRSLPRSANARARPPSQAVLAIQSWPPRQAQARAPPM